MNDNLVVGVDVGGSHITAAIIDLASHNIIRESFTRQHINAKGTAQEIISAWANAIKKCKSFCPDASNKIGIAIPGPFDYEKGISLIKGLDKFESLYKLDVKALLAEGLSIKPIDIFLMNDASCFLKGEIFAGAAMNCKRVIGLTLGTGLGSAVYKENFLYDGDLYFTPYKNATAEDYLSTRWFIKEYKAQTGYTAANVKEIGERIVHDERAAELFKTFGHHLGEVLAAYINRHKPQTAVIGGNIILAWNLFMPEVQHVLELHGITVPIVKAMLGEEAALLGAGSLCA
ncbi:hypothetical protein BH10BAC3_BH10BAC3_18430 [soil metagenome]